MRLLTVAFAAALALGVGGCGLAYQAGTRIKAGRIADSLHAGEGMPEVHKKWGEPDIRDYRDHDVEVWSYPYKPNSNDLASTLFFTSDKSGNKGIFLDLKFIDGKLVSWSEGEHTMPPKEGDHLGLKTLGFGGGTIAPSSGTTGPGHY